MLIEDKVGLEKLHNEYDYEFDNSKKVFNFYNHKYSTYPGISYIYKSGVDVDTDIWVWKPLRQFIGKINIKYAKYYNKKYNYIGRLFQDRYFSELIESDAQMLETSRYIHLNPVRAKIVEKPENYIKDMWSLFSC